jgi:hypothetical protein
MKANIGELRAREPSQFLFTSPRHREPFEDIAVGLIQGFTSQRKRASTKMKCPVLFRIAKGHEAWARFMRPDAKGSRPVSNRLVRGEEGR